MTKKTAAATASAALMLDYQAADKTIAAFHASTASVRYIRGCRASSKSSACVMDLFSQANQMPPCRDGVRRSRFLVARATYGSLVRTTLKTVTNWLDPISETRYSVPPVTRIQQKLMDGTSIDCEILYQPLPDVASLQNLRSLELSAAYCSEIVEMPIEVLAAVSGSIGRFPGLNQFDRKYTQDEHGRMVLPYKAGIIIDTNPGEDAGAWNKWEDNPGDDASVFIQPGAYLEFTAPQIATYAAHNPHIKPHIIERFGFFYVPNPQATFVRIVPGGFGYWKKIIMAANDRSEILMLVVNKWAVSKAGMPCWPGYDDSLHLAATECEPDPRQPLFIGIDHSGLHPAAVLGQLIGPRLVIYESMSPSDETGGTGFAEFCEDSLVPALKARYDGMQVRIILDPQISRDQLNMRTVTDLLLDYGLSSVPAPTNDPKLRLDSVAKRLTRKGGIVVSRSPHTPHILKALRGGHHFPPNKDGTFKLAPNKHSKSSHVADALTYLSVYLDVQGRSGSSTAAKSTTAGKGFLAR